MVYEKVIAFLLELKLSILKTLTLNILIFKVYSLGFFAENPKFSFFNFYLVVNDSSITFSIKTENSYFFTVYFLFNVIVLLLNLVREIEHHWCFAITSKAIGLLPELKLIIPALLLFCHVLKGMA